MATDGPTPTPRNSKIFQKGQGACVVSGPSNANVGGPPLWRNGVTELGDPINERTSVVIEQDGATVLVDPMVHAVATTVAKLNCQNTFNMNADRVAHFKRRLAELGKKPDEAVIVLLNVDDKHGNAMADILMPGHDWDSIRAEGATPFARGLTQRQWVMEAIGIFDSEASEKMSGMNDVTVVVVDHGVAEAFAA